MPRHIEQPGSRHWKPASRKTLSSPSFSACVFTRPEPGTTIAMRMLEAILRPDMAHDLGKDALQRGVSAQAGGGVDQDQHIGRRGRDRRAPPGIRQQRGLEVQGRLPA